MAFALVPHSIKQGGNQLKIAVLYSDDRMEHVGNVLGELFDVLQINESTDFLTLPCVDAIVFPVKGVDDFGYVQLRDTRVYIPSRFWSMMEKNTILFCGIKNNFLEKLPQQKLYYMKDPQVIHDNAILTAEGVLNELIGCSNRSIYDLQVDIIGYGNCGKVIYEMLHNLQVKVRVIRRECERKDDFLPMEEWGQCGDVIINTSVQKVMDEQRMSVWEKKPIIIDIATPDVIDVKAASKWNIKVLKAANLPGRFACITAGDIIAEYIRGKLKNEK